MEAPITDVPSSNTRRIRPVKWEEIQGLLGGSAREGELLSDITAEEVNQSDLCVVMHDCCVTFLRSYNENIRINASLIIHKLFIKHSKYLTLALTNSILDGCLMTIADINIEKILASKIQFGYASQKTIQKTTVGQYKRDKHNTLSKEAVSSSGKPLLHSSQDAVNPLTSSIAQLPSELDVDSLYSKHWVTEQRKRLVERLCLDSSAVEDTISARYVDFTSMVADVDITPMEMQGKRKIRNQASNSSLKSKKRHTEECMVDQDVKESTHNIIVEETSENWFMRLVRYLLLGLVNDIWEIRHGAALGLRGILGVRGLPLVLIEEISAISTLVLLLDRVIDCSDMDAIPPVKTACAQLLASSLPCKEDHIHSDVITSVPQSITTTNSDSLLQMVVQMCTSNSWHVMQSGLLCVKYILSLKQIEYIIYLINQNITIIAIQSLTHSIDEVVVAASTVLESLADTIISVNLIDDNLYKQLKSTLDLMMELSSRCCDDIETPSPVCSAMCSASRIANTLLSLINSSSECLLTHLETHLEFFFHAQLRYLSGTCALIQQQCSSSQELNVSCIRYLSTITSNLIFILRFSIESTNFILPHVSETCQCITTTLIPCLLSCIIKCDPLQSSIELAIVNEICEKLSQFMRCKANIVYNQISSHIPSIGFWIGSSEQITAHVRAILNSSNPLAVSSLSTLITCTLISLDCNSDCIVTTLNYITTGISQLLNSLLTIDPQKTSAFRLEHTARKSSSNLRMICSYLCLHMDIVSMVASDSTLDCAQSLSALELVITPYLHIEELSVAMTYVRFVHVVERQSMNCLANLPISFTSSIAHAIATAMYRVMKSSDVCLQNSCISLEAIWFASGRIELVTSVVQILIHKSTLDGEARAVFKVISLEHILSSDFPSDLIVPTLLTLLALLDKADVTYMIQEQFIHRLIETVITKTSEIDTSYANLIHSLLLVEEALEPGCQQLTTAIRERLVDVKSVTSRRRACDLLLLFVDTLKEEIYSNYSDWLTISLLGVADFDSHVRKRCAGAMRALIRKAAIGKTFVTSANSSSVVTRLIAGEPVPSLVADTLFMEKLRLSFQTTQCNALRDYQWEGVSWLTSLRRCGLSGILCDEMGLGKTVQALTVIAVNRTEKLYNTHASLVVCPASVVTHWKHDISKFFNAKYMKPLLYSDLASQHFSSSCIVVDDDEPQSWIANLQGNEVIIISYTKLLRDLTVFRDIVWECLILDEAHLIKNSNTLTAKAVYSINAKFRMALSGTPLQNSVDELWSVFHFLMPDFLGDLQIFRKDYALPIAKSFLHERAIGSKDSRSSSSITISIEGLSKLRQLHKQVLPFILRRNKDTVAKELPPKTIIDIHCVLTTTQRAAYAEYQDGLSISDDSLETKLDAIRVSSDALDSGKKKLNPLHALLQLNLISVHPSLAINSARCDDFSLRNESGKLFNLAKLLLESNVVHPHECVDLQSLDDEGAFVTTQTVRIESETNAKMPVSKALESAVASTKASRKSCKAIVKSVEVHTAPLLTNELTNHRCLIFAQHLSVLDLVEKHVLKAYFPCVPYMRLDGKMDPKRRGEIAAEFNSQSTKDTEISVVSSEISRIKRRANGVRKRPETCIRILLMTTRSCSLGLNLSAADTVIFIQHDWNPFVDMQAMDRCHRIGQENPVTVYRLIAESTIEERIANLQSLKKLLAGEIINNENAAGSSGVGFSSSLWDNLVDA